MLSLTVLICALSGDASFWSTAHAITGRETPQARPRASLEGTNTYGTFCGVISGCAARGMGAHLVLAEEGKMEQNFQGLRVGGHHDELRAVAVQRLRGLVRALLQLLVVLRLGDHVPDGLLKLRVRERVCLRVDSALSLRAPREKGGELTARRDAPSMQPHWEVTRKRRRARKSAKSERFYANT